MATSNPGFGNFKLIEGSPNIRSYPKESALQVSRGDPVIVSGGKLADLTNTTNNSFSSFYAVAAEKNTSTGTTASVACYIMTEGQIWEISGTASATTGSSIGSKYTAPENHKITVTTTNNAPQKAKAKTTTTNTASGPVIIGWKGGDASATSGNRVLVKFPNNMLQHL